MFGNLEDAVKEMDRTMILDDSSVGYRDTPDGWSDQRSDPHEIKAEDLRFYIECLISMDCSLEYYVLAPVSNDPEHWRL